MKSSRIVIAGLCFGVVIFTDLPASMSVEHNTLASSRTTSQKAGQAAKKYAEKFREKGKAAYTAALREALSAMATDSGEFDPTRSITVAKQRVGTPSTVTILKIDEDKTYQKWLSENAARPLEILDIEGIGNVGLKIVGGNRLTSLTSFSEINALQSLKSGPGPDQDPFCSGVLIDKRHVLTAAHCLCGNSTAGTAPENIDFGVDLMSGDGVTSVAVANFVRHSNKVICTGSVANLPSTKGRDIGLVRLDIDAPLYKPEVGNRTLSFIDPERFFQEFNSGNKSLVVVGFGETKTQPDKNRKMYVRVPIMSPKCTRVNFLADDPTKTDAEHYGCVPNREIVALHWKPIGPCFGDSGGGAYIIRDPDGPSGPKKKTVVLIGLVSRSMDSPSMDCGDAAIYTLLTAEHRKWIKDAKACLLKHENDGDSASKNAQMCIDS